MLSKFEQLKEDQRGCSRDRAKARGARGSSKVPGADPAAHCTLR